MIRNLRICALLRRKRFAFLIPVMRTQRMVFVLPAVMALTGCGYVHIGRLPEPSTTVIADAQVLNENAELRLEKKMLQQELQLARAQGEALRMAVENRAADGDTSKRLVDRLNESSRELATLRASYARLQAERDQAVTTSAEAAGLKARLGAAEDQLAASLRTHTQLQEEVVRLRGEVARSREENLALSTQVKSVTESHEAAKLALSQLNSELLAQKEARFQAEQDAEVLRTELKTLAPNSSLLARERSGTADGARSIVAEHAVETAALKEQLATLQARLDVLEAERQRLQRQLGVTPSADLANVEAKFASVLQENQQLKSVSNQLAGQKSELENQIARLQASPAAGQVQILREQLREAQARAIALVEENTRLSMQVPGRSGAPAPTPSPAGVEPSGNGSAARTVVTEATRIDLGTDKTPPPSERAGPAGMTRGSVPVSATLVTSATGGARLPQGQSRIEMDGQRVHVVASGDTLAKISMQYYGTPARWGDILAANRDVLGETNNLVVGRTLRIP